MRLATTVLAGAFAATLSAAGTTPAPLSLASARVSLDGTSNIHAFTASTTEVRVTAIDINGTPTGDLLDYMLQPGGLKAFEIVIPAASLSSPKDGIDKNMHKALKVEEYPDIRFKLRTLEPTAGAYRAIGLLTIAGVEKEVTLTLQIERKGATLAVTGGTELLMTDYGVKPPKAMLGMLRTNPKVQIRIELVLGASLT
jgi:polyisoprenoid-binding protein YceI